MARMSNREPRTGRLLAALALIAAFALGAGCFNVDTGHPTGAECEGQVDEDAFECAGEVCLALLPNAQGVGGLCSAPCSVDEECTPHDRCVSIESTAASFCMRACLTDDDCFDRSVCRLFTAGNPTRFCLADPL